VLDLLLCPTHKHCTSSYHIKKEATVLCLLFCIHIYKKTKQTNKQNCMWCEQPHYCGEKWHRFFSNSFKGSANSASVCHISVCELMVSLKDWPQNPNFSFNITTHKPKHHVIILCGLTWDFLQTITCHSECGFSCCSMHCTDVPVHQI